MVSIKTLILISSRLFVPENHKIVSFLKGSKYNAKKTKIYLYHFRHWS